MKKVAIALDIGGTNIKGAVVSYQGEIVHQEIIPTKCQEGYNAIIKRIGQFVRMLLSKVNVCPVGLGVGVPGVVNTGNGIVEASPNLNWHQMPLQESLIQETNMNVFLENDANAAAIGEWWKGAGRGAKNMLHITIGTGIGAGIIINGVIYRGSSERAGELGHNIWKQDGQVCNCGLRGCVEAYAGVSAMTKYVQEGIKQGAHTILKNKIMIKGSDITEAALSGDTLALDAINRSAAALGDALANAANLLDPDLITIGGGISEAGALILDRIDYEVQKRLEVYPGRKVPIKTGILGNKAGMIGAVYPMFK